MICQLLRDVANDPTSLFHRHVGLLKWIDAYFWRTLNPEQRYDAFIYVIDQVSRCYDPARGSKLAPYVARAARHARARVRQAFAREASRQSRRVDLCDSRHPTTAATATVDPLEVAEARAAARRALRGRRLERAAFEAIIFRGETFADVGRRLGISGETARQRYHRAVARVRRECGVA